MNLPNRITLLRIALIPVVLLLMAAHTRVCDVLALICFIAAAATDYIDGRIARARGEITNFGKLMDPIADKLLVVSVLILLAARQTADARLALDVRLVPWLLILIVAREFTISGFRLVAASQGRVIAASNLAKVKTVVQLIVVALLMLHWPAIAWLTVTMEIIAVVFTVWSGVDYIVLNKHVLADLK